MSNVNFVCGPCALDGFASLLLLMHVPLIRETCLTRLARVSVRRKKETVKDKHLAYLGVQLGRISLLMLTDAASERIMAVTVTCHQCGYRASASLPRGKHPQGGLPSLLVLLSFSLSPHLLSFAQCGSLFAVSVHTLICELELAVRPASCSSATRELILISPLEKQDVPFFHSLKTVLFNQFLFSHPDAHLSSVCSSPRFLPRFHAHQYRAVLATPHSPRCGGRLRNRTRMTRMLSSREHEC